VDETGLTYHFRCDLHHTIPTLENVDLSTIQMWLKIQLPQGFQFTLHNVTPSDYHRGDSSPPKLSTEVIHNVNKPVENYILVIHNPQQGGHKVNRYKVDIGHVSV